MAWIRVDQSLRHHRKLIALANELGIETAAATGYLVLLWLWCLDNAPTGILKEHPTKPANNSIGNIRLIATACAWSGDPNELVSALLASGFLDKCGRGGSLRIHNWEEYGGKLLQSRDRHREVVRQSRDRLDQSRSDQSRREKIRVEKKPPPTPSDDPAALTLDYEGDIHFEEEGDDPETLEQDLNALFPEGWKVKAHA